MITAKQSKKTFIEKDMLHKFLNYKNLRNSSENYLNMTFDAHVSSSFLFNCI